MASVARVAVFVFVSGISTAGAQDSAPAEPYDVDAAYQVYGVLLPHEESSRFAKGTLVNSAGDGVKTN